MTLMRMMLLSKFLVFQLFWIYDMFRINKSFVPKTVFAIILPKNWLSIHHVH